MSKKPFISYGRQDITKDDIEAVTNVLKSDFLTQGPCVPKFEKRVSEYCDTKYALALNSSTSALHISCLSLGLKSGDWLWTSPITFVASANCGVYCGAKVDFVDIDPHTYNLCPKALKKKLIYAKKEGKLPKILIPVHFGGQPCDMEAIYALSKEFNFKIIEDASHAIGGKYQNQPVGNCKYSDVTVFSFHPVKIITTGEGGMALTNNHKIAERIGLLRTHGITKNPGQMINEPHGDWYYEQVDLGFNYRMTDIQAALGVSQLTRLDNYVSRRHDLAKRYGKLLKNLPLTTPYQNNDNYSAFHLYVIRLIDSNKHKLVFDYLRKANIGVNIHYIPVHMQPYYSQMNNNYNDLKQSELYYKDAISIPLFPTMREIDQDYIVDSIRKALQK